MGLGRRPTLGHGELAHMKLWNEEVDSPHVYKLDIHREGRFSRGAAPSILSWPTRFDNTVIIIMGLTKSSGLETSVDVLIIGAGPAGLMCANALGRAGVNVRIVDQRYEHTPMLVLSSC